MITFLFLMWYAEIVLKAVAAYRLCQTRVMLEFPVLFIFLITSVMKSTLLVQFRHDPARNATVYSISVPLMLVLQYLCSIEIFERLTGNYPDFGRIGKFFLIGFAILGVTASTATRHVGVPATWQGVGEAAVLLDRYALLALFVGLVLMAVFVPQHSSAPSGRNARRGALIMGFYVVGNAASVAVAAAAGAARALVPSYVIVITGLLASVGWITMLAKKEEPGSSDDAPRTVRQELRNYLRVMRILRGGAATQPAARR